MDSNSFSFWIKNKRKEHGSLVKLPKLIPFLLTELWDKAKDFFDGPEKPGQKPFELRRNLYVHPRIKPEHLWERFITQSMPDKIFFNQFSLTKTNNIDLLKINKQCEITDIFELKTGSNELGHAAYEIIFYYFLLLEAEKRRFLKNCKVSKHINLIVLAPEYYYKTPYQQEFIKELQNNLRKDIKYNKVSIKFILLPESSNKETIKQTTKKIRSKIVNKQIPAALQNLKNYFIKCL